MGRRSSMGLSRMHKILGQLAWCVVWLRSLVADQFPGAVDAPYSPRGSKLVTMSLCLRWCGPGTWASALVCFVASPILLVSVVPVLLSVKPKCPPRSLCSCETIRSRCGWCGNLMPASRFRIWVSDAKAHVFWMLTLPTKALRYSYVA